MIVMRRIMILCWSALCFEAQGQITPPESLGRHSYTVSLPTRVPEHCVALSSDVAHVILDTEILKRRIANSPPFYGQDIKTLLELASGAERVHGCRVLAGEKVVPLWYLFSGGVEAGEAVVIEKGQQTPVQTVVVDFIAGRGAGDVYYYIRHGDRRHFHYRSWYVR